MPGAEIDHRCLFIPYRDSVSWGNLGPKLDFASLGGVASEAASFYFTYVQGDAMHAIE